MSVVCCMLYVVVRALYVTLSSPSSPLTYPPIYLLFMHITVVPPVVSLVKTYDPNAGKRMIGSLILKSMHFLLAVGAC